MVKRNWQLWLMMFSLLSGTTGFFSLLGMLGWTGFGIGVYGMVEGIFHGWSWLIVLFLFLLAYGLWPTVNNTKSQRKTRHKVNREQGFKKSAISVNKREMPDVPDIPEIPRTLQPRLKTLDGFANYFAGEVVFSDPHLSNDDDGVDPPESSRNFQYPETEKKSEKSKQWFSGTVTAESLGIDLVEEISPPLPNRLPPSSATRFQEKEEQSQAQENPPTERRTSGDEWESADPLSFMRNNPEFPEKEPEEPSKQRSHVLNQGEKNMTVVGPNRLPDVLPDLCDSNRPHFETDGDLLLEFSPNEASQEAQKPYLEEPTLSEPSSKEPSSVQLSINEPIIAGPSINNELSLNEPKLIESSMSAPSINESTPIEVPSIEPVFKEQGSLTSATGQTNTKSKVKLAIEFALDEDFEEVPTEGVLEEDPVILNEEALTVETLKEEKEELLAGEVEADHISIPPVAKESIIASLHTETGAVLYPRPEEKLVAAVPNQATLVPIRRKINWNLPSLDLLEKIPENQTPVDVETPRQLEKVLADFGIKAHVKRVTRGPVVTRFELTPAPGVKISRIVNLADDITLALAAPDVRIEAPIPGRGTIGIEVPNKNPRVVPFREMLGDPTYRQNQSKLKTALGKDISDLPVIADLGKMPHLLIAGATGSGKSVCVSSIINSILFNATPDEVKLLLIDPKVVELSLYNEIPHLLAPVVTDAKKAAAALKWVVKEMETRYSLFASAGVRDIVRYNKARATEGVEGGLPWVVVIIDELADLMLVAARDVEEAICRLAQMARAAGIHLVIATQRPSVDVITGIIKANIPSRISFAVSSQIDSRTILDAAGAEKLIGRGDMLYSPLGQNKPLRVQGCLVSDEEVQNVIVHWKKQGRPEYLNPESLFETSIKGDDGGPSDEMFLDAGRLILKNKVASVSFLQRKMKLGYSRAARIMDMLEEYDVVGASEGSKPRQLLMEIEEFNERFG